MQLPDKYLGEETADVIERFLDENLSNELTSFCMNKTIFENSVDQSLNSQLLRNLEIAVLDQKGSKYPEIKGLATTVIVVTCVAAAIYYIGYLYKDIDTQPFWMLLHFIQVVYLMIILEVNQPANLVYFLDRLDHCKLDLNYIDEFTGIRNAIIDDLKFKPDRDSYQKIDWEYGSVLISLAFYARIFCTVLVLHFALKLVLLFKNRKTEKNPILIQIERFKTHISNVFYIRYCLEVSLFFWTAIFIEFVSTSADSNLEKLSLVFSINVLCFLVWFTFSYLFASFAKNTKETYRSYYYTYFLLKRA